MKEKIFEESANLIQSIHSRFKNNLKNFNDKRLEILVDSEVMGIDIWWNMEEVVELKVLSQNPIKNLEELYIKSRNHLKLDLIVIANDLTIKKIIIEAPGIELKTSYVFEEAIFFISNTKVSIPDYLASKVSVHKCKNLDEEKIQNNLEGMIIIPGCGEFVLDPENSIGKNAAKSVDQLVKTFPNMKWVSPVVAWFGTNLKIKECKIMPGIDIGYDKDLLKSWKVGGYDSDTAHKLSFDKGGVSYGGSVNDISVCKYLSLLKHNNLKIIFYPLIMLDVEGKVWRGRLEGEAEDVEAFYNNQYEPFILHYANLVKDYVDAFIIGSEFVSLTRIHDDNFNFPFVEKLVGLSGKVKSIMGSNVKITYAADWSEYHTADGTHRPLDKLWACPNIDLSTVFRTKNHAIFCKFSYSTGDK